MTPQDDFVTNAICEHKQNFVELFHSLGNVSHDLCKHFLEQALLVDNAFVVEFFYKQNITFERKHYLFLFNERKKNNCLEFFLNNEERKNELMRQNLYCMSIKSPVIFQACRVLPPHYIQHFWSHFDVNCKNSQNATPLYAAINYANLETIRYLIQDCGADINYDCVHWLGTPLEHALCTRDFLYVGSNPSLSRYRHLASNEREIKRVKQYAGTLFMLGANWPRFGFPDFFKYYPLCLLLYCFQHKSVSESSIISLDFEIFFHL